MSATWTHDDPGVGSPADLRGYATMRWSAASTLRTDAAAHLDGALVNAHGWTADTATAVISVVTRIQPEPLAIADQLENEARTLNAYAAEVERIQAQVRSIRDRREEAESRIWSAEVELNAYSARFDIITGAEAAEQARLERVITKHTDQIADLDRELRALVTDCQNADTACVSGLSGAGVLGALAAVTGTASGGGSLLAKLARLTPTELLILGRARPDVFEQLRTRPPSIAEVSDWWAGLDDASQTALIAAVPTLIGSMNGIPALARVEANRVNSIALIAASKAEIERLTAPQRDKSFGDWYRISQTGGYADAKREGDATDRIALLHKEIAYLEQVRDGTVQLYLYDRDGSRIIEMIGTPSETTTKVITYVPGTFTSLFSFYDGGVQEVAGYLTTEDSNTVAFVYKDGIFPGEDEETGEANLLRIGEANDQAFARQSGVTLAAFESGLQSDPLFSGREQIAIGHSWGLANVTSSEVADAHYDKVISLSGAGMLPEWRQDPTTEYADFSYQDLLQTAQDMDAVWDGNNPRTNPAFEHGEYFRGPDDEILDNAVTTLHTPEGPVASVDVRAFGVLMDNHNLITQVDDNRVVLERLLQMVQR